MAEPFKTSELENGLTVYFCDSSNRYFGDFHRVCIDVRIDVPLDFLKDVGQREAAVKLKVPLRFEKRLERMGVASADLQSIRAKLVDDFLASSGSYLGHPEFAQQLLKRKLTERVKPFFLQR